MNPSIPTTIAALSRVKAPAKKVVVKKAPAKKAPAKKAPAKKAVVKKQNKSTKIKNKNK